MTTQQLANVLIRGAYIYHVSADDEYAHAAEHINDLINSLAEGAECYAKDTDEHRDAYALIELLAPYSSGAADFELAPNVVSAAFMLRVDTFRHTLDAQH